MENIKLTVIEGGGEIKAKKSEWGSEEWKLTVEGTDLRDNNIKITQTIDIREGVGEISKWVRNEDIVRIKVPLWKEMGGQFNERQQSLWYRQAVRDLIQTGVLLELVLRDTEEEQWVQEQIWE